MESVAVLLRPFLNGKAELLSISGPSASGKTTLALQLLCTILNPEKEQKGIWVQASEAFSKKRIHSLLGDDEKGRAYVLKNTFIVPPAGVIQSFGELEENINALVNQDLPFGLKLLVIDNISHHLRHYLSLQASISARSKAVNRFFDECLFPLIMRCKREGVHLILIHEVSQDIETGRTRSFYYKLFNRIRSTSISFHGSTRLGTQELRIDAPKMNTFRSRYELKRGGIILLEGNLTFINPQ